MVSLTATWTQEEHADRKLLASFPETAVLLPWVDQAHNGLIKTQIVVGVTPERLAQIQVEEKQVDDRHDDVIRGHHVAFTALGYFAKDPQRRALFFNLRDQLLPDGLSATQKTYREEAGQGAMLESRISPEVKKVLAKVHLGDGTTLWDKMEEWIHLAARLNDLENERDGGGSGTPITPSERLLARNFWIRVVNMVADTIDLLNHRRLDSLRKRIEEVGRMGERRASTPDDEEPTGDTGGAPPHAKVAEEAEPPRLAVAAMGPEKTEPEQAEKKEK